MTFGFLVLAFVAAANAARVRLALPERQGRRARLDVLAAGSLVTLAGVAALAAGADALHGGLDVSPESWRIAAGLVLGIGGLRVLAAPRPGEDPVLPGLWAALVPVAFPRLLTPELVVFAVASGADEGATRTVGAAAAAFTFAFVLGLIPRRAVADGLLEATARLLGAVLLVVGVALVVDGVRDV